MIDFSGEIADRFENAGYSKAVPASGYAIPANENRIVIFPE